MSFNVPYASMVFYRRNFVYETFLGSSGAISAPSGGGKLLHFKNIC